SSTSSFSKLRPVTAIASKSCFELIGFNSRYIDIAAKIRNPTLSRIFYFITIQTITNSILIV
ncbi:hypothetical protein ECE17_04295, partial [Acinetobacter baumannii]|nr:hypothetical protein [Acinetobacter baumannii]